MNQSNLLLRVADFSLTPGPRYKSEGKFSAEEFREDVLLPQLQAAVKSKATLTVILDGVHGYGTSFFEASFGGLIRENNFSLADLDLTLRLVSEEVPRYLEEIRHYMEQAESEGPANG